MPERLSFEQFGLPQAAPGFTPFDSLPTDPLRPTPIPVPENALDAHTVTPQQLAVLGEVFPRGIYRLLPGLGIVPQKGAIPDRFMQVHQPFSVLLPHGFRWNAPKGPLATPTTAGSLRLPVAAEDADERIWRVFGDKRDEGLQLGIDLGGHRPDLVIPQFDIHPPENNTAKTIFDMAQRSSAHTKPAAVPKAIDVQPKTPIKPDLQAAQPVRKPRSRTLPPSQRSFDFSSLTPKAVISASLAIEQPTVEVDTTKSTYQPKAGDTGQVPLERNATRSDFQGHLDFRGARTEQGFWEPPSYVTEFWNTEMDGHKPFKKITVIHGSVYFVPKNKQILGVRAYPDGVVIDEYPDLDVFGQGVVLANQICFIPSAGSSHEGIIFPVNGSCNVCVVVPNHEGEYDFSDGKNRGPIPAGSTVTRREDKLLCEFDPFDDPNTRYATYHLFAPGSRGATVSNLSPQDAQKQFMNNYYRNEARKRAKQASLEKAGTVFSVRI